MAKKLTLEQLDKDVLEALEVPDQNEPRRLRTGRPGLLQDLLNRGTTPTTRTQRKVGNGS